MAISKPKGVVRFPAFQEVDEASLREMGRFGVYLPPNFLEHCRHIPYNSGKKDFYDKTGRESFEGESGREGQSTAIHHHPPAKLAVPSING